MKNSIEIANSSYIDLTRERVLETLLDDGLDVFVFRNGINIYEDKLIVEGNPSATVFINGAPSKKGMEFGIDLQFEVPLEEAQRIIEIRDKLRQTQKP